MSKDDAKVKRELLEIAAVADLEELTAAGDVEDWASR